MFTWQFLIHSSYMGNSAYKTPLVKSLYTHSWCLLSVGTLFDHFFLYLCSLFSLVNILLPVITHITQVQLIKLTEPTFKWLITLMEQHFDFQTYYHTKITIRNFNLRRLGHCQKLWTKPRIEIDSVQMWEVIAWDIWLDSCMSCPKYPAILKRKNWERGVVIIHIIQSLTH